MFIFTSYKFDNECIEDKEIIEILEYARNNTQSCKEVTEDMKTSLNKLLSGNTFGWLDIKNTRDFLIVAQVYQKNLMSIRPVILKQCTEDMIKKFIKCWGKLSKY